MTYLGPGYTPIFYSIMFHALIIYLFNDFTDLQHGDVYVYKEQWDTDRKVCYMCA